MDANVTSFNEGEFRFLPICVLFVKNILHGSPRTLLLFSMFIVYIKNMC